MKALVYFLDHHIQLKNQLNVSLLFLLILFGAFKTNQPAPLIHQPSGSASYGPRPQQTRPPQTRPAFKKPVEVIPVVEPQIKEVIKLEETPLSAEDSAAVLAILAQLRADLVKFQTNPAGEKIATASIAAIDNLGALPPAPEPQKTVIKATKIENTATKKWVPSVEGELETDSLLREGEDEDDRDIRHEAIIMTLNQIQQYKLSIKKIKIELENQEKKIKEMEEKDDFTEVRTLRKLKEAYSKLKRKWAIEESDLEEREEILQTQRER